MDEEGCSKLSGQFLEAKCWHKGHCYNFSYIHYYVGFFPLLFKVRKPHKKAWFCWDAKIQCQEISVQKTILLC